MADKPEDQKEQKEQLVSGNAPLGVLGVLKERLSLVKQVFAEAFGTLKFFLTEPAPGDKQTDLYVGKHDQSEDWLRQLLNEIRPAYKQTLWISFVVNLLALGSSVFVMQIYDRVIAHYGISSLVALASGMVLVIAFDFMLRCGRALLLRQVGVKLDVVMGRKVLTHLLAQPTIVLENKPAGYWQTLFRDVELVRTTCAGAPALLLIDLPFTLVSILVVGMVAWAILPVQLFFVAWLILLAWRSGKVVRKASEQEREQELGREAFLAELSVARNAVKYQVLDEMMWKRFERASAIWLEENLARSAQSDRYRDEAHAITMASTVSVTAVGALAILNHLLSMGSLVAANMMSARIVSPFVQLVGQWRSFGMFKSAKDRLDTFFAEPLERTHSAVVLPRPQGVMVLDNITFRYPNSEADQIKPLRGQVGPFGLHAIIGHNGSGKSTVLKMLRGLYRPLTGRIMLDGADMQQFAQKDIAQWVAYLPQQVQLFTGSIRDNIVLTKPEATDEDVIRAAMLAGAHEFIVQMPAGYDTLVGELGMRLSGGQRKRVAIAQMLLRDPAIILMDEPTADLDQAAEQALVKNLLELSKDHTIVLVTHSPLILQQCNGILVMDHGQLVLAGAARDVLARLSAEVNKSKPENKAELVQS